jgi:hypothetical protein
MRAGTRAFLDDLWAGNPGCPHADLRQRAQVRPHARLVDCPGFWVAWRATGVHVSTPSSVSKKDANSLATQGFESLTDPGPWSAYAAERGWVLVGPALHSNLDEDPRDDGMVPRFELSLLAGLSAVTPEEEWRERQHPRMFRRRTTCGVAFVRNGAAGWVSRHTRTTWPRARPGDPFTW